MPITANPRFDPNQPRAATGQWTTYKRSPSAVVGTLTAEHDHDELLELPEPALFDLDELHVFTATPEEVRAAFGHCHKCHSAIAGSLEGGSTGAWLPGTTCPNCKWTTPELSSEDEFGHVALRAGGELAYLDAEGNVAEVLAPTHAGDHATMELWASEAAAVAQVSPGALVAAFVGATNPNDAVRLAHPDNPGAALVHAHGICPYETDGAPQTELDRWAITHAADAYDRSYAPAVAALRRGSAMRDLPPGPNAGQDRNLDPEVERHLTSLAQWVDHPPLVEHYRDLVAQGVLTNAQLAQADVSHVEADHGAFIEPALAEIGRRARDEVRRDITTRHTHPLLAATDRSAAQLRRAHTAITAAVHTGNPELVVEILEKVATYKIPPALQEAMTQGARQLHDATDW